MRKTPPCCSSPLASSFAALVFAAVFAAFGASGCSAAPATSQITDRDRAEIAPTEAWKAYWYRGLAEISSYTLEQARYGEIHRGEAVLIFVTEDFSAKKQVKLDRPEAAPTNDRIPILKLNLTKKFDTGIYPYSLMTSVFSPVEGRPTIKVTTSGQEWCGHVYQQLNHTPDARGGYRLRSFSYFESEVEEDRILAGAWLEDELWNRLRLDPQTLPVGKFRVIPATLFGRLHHHPLAVVEASATLDETSNPVFGSEPMRRYHVSFERPEPRTLTIYFEAALPHRILGWEEAYADGFGTPKPLLTRAVRKKTIELDYWNRHNNADAPLRKELGLE